MKRAWTKKIKTVSACVAINTWAGQLKSVQPRSKRRVRTSVAMIGLTISMGVPNVLLTRQSDRTPAAEPVSNEPMFDTVPATVEVSSGASINSPIAEALKSMPTAVSSAAPANSQAKEDRLRSGQTPDLSQKAQITAASTTQSVETASANSQTSLQTQRKREVSPEQAIVNKLQNNGTGVNHGQLARQVAEVPGVQNRWKDILAEPRSEKSNNQEVSITNSVGPSTSEQAQTINQANPAPVIAGATVVPKVAETPLQVSEAQDSAAQESPMTDRPQPTATVATLGQKQAALLSPQVVTGNQVQEKQSTAVLPSVRSYPAPTINQANIKPKAAVATLGQRHAALLSPQLDRAILDQQKPQETRSAAVVEPVPSVVAEPTPVPAPVLPEYQVKAGDTLTAIARSYGVSVSELVNTNSLTNPNQLQINQQIRIPVFQYSKTTSQPIAVITDSSVTIATAQIAASGLTLPVVPPVSSSTDNSVAVLGSAERRRPYLSLSAPTLPENSETLKNAELVAYNPQASSHQANLATPSVADTDYTGMGGGISDEADLGTTTIKDSQQVQKTVQSSTNPYFQNLQTDVQKLRQKYYAQLVDLRQLHTETEVERIVVRRTVAAPVQGQSLKKRMATAPMDVEPSGSLQSFVGTDQQHVSPALPPLAPGDNYLPKPFDTSAPFKGYIWPTKGVLTSGYGWRWGRMHRGIDIAAPTGTPVFAAATGVVIRARWSSGGYGNLVDVQHADGSFTRYAHNKRILVQVGQQVQQGQQISLMGSTGFSTGPHCHFEVHPQGKGAVNPIALLPTVKKLSRF